MNSVSSVPENVKGGGAVRDAYPLVAPAVRPAT
jgi:hypothetical protein